METKAYAGKVHAVYRAEARVPLTRSAFFEGKIIALFDSREGAERFIKKRETQDGFRGERCEYSVVPWLVQHG